MTTVAEGEALRLSSLEHLWMHNKDWTQMAEKGDPVVMVEGKGVRVTDSTGKTWIDANAGYNCVNIGYGRTEVAEAAYEQMQQVTYFPNGTTTIPVIELCEKLAQLTPGGLSRTFLCSGGSEANETALKIARAYHKRRGDAGRYKVISRKRSYHGTTHGVLWLGGDRGDLAPRFGRKDFEPVYPGTLYAPQPDPYSCDLGGETPSECAVRCADAIEQLILAQGPETVAAVIGEPISFPAAAAVPGDEYWPRVRDICDKYGVLLIVDEVICGFGRTGKMFASEYWDLEPDIMTVAKGIVSAYLPLAGAVVSQDVADVFGGEGNQISHALTFGGHPVAAAAALKNIEILESENMVANSAEVGAYLQGRLLELQEKHQIIGAVKGLGLMLGLELVTDRDTKARFTDESKIADRITQGFKKRGLILHAGREAITIGPPLCITRDEADEVVTIIDETLGDVESQLGVS